MALPRESKLHRWIGHLLDEPVPPAEQSTSKDVHASTALPMQARSDAVAAAPVSAAQASTVAHAGVEEQRPALLAQAGVVAGGVVANTPPPPPPPRPMMGRNGGMAPPTGWSPWAPVLPPPPPPPRPATAAAAPPLMRPAAAAMGPPAGMPLQAGWQVPAARFLTGGPAAAAAAANLAAMHPAQLQALMAAAMAGRLSLQAPALGQPPPPPPPPPPRRPSSAGQLVMPAMPPKHSAAGILAATSKDSSPQGGHVGRPPARKALNPAAPVFEVQQGLTGAVSGAQQARRAQSAEPRVSALPATLDDELYGAHVDLLQHVAMCDATTQTDQN